MTRDAGSRRGRRVLLSALAGTAVGAALLWIVFRKVDGAALAAALAASSPALVCLALLAGLGAFATKALRWVVLLRGVVQLPVQASLEAVFVGGAGNALFSHLGEVPRIMMAARATGAGSAGLLTSILAERVFDVVALAALLTLLLIWTGGEISGPERLAILLGSAGLAAVLFALAVLYLGEPVARRLDGGHPAGQANWRVAAASRLRQVLEALEVFRSGAHLSPVLILSIGMWVLFAVCIFLCLRATGTEASFGDALVVLGVIAVALVLPAPPGRVGVVQAGFAVALAGASTSKAQVLGASIIYNALMTIPMWLIGALIWWRQSIRRPDPGPGSPGLRDGRS